MVSALTTIKNGEGMMENVEWEFHVGSSRRLHIRVYVTDSCASTPAHKSAALRPSHTSFGHQLKGYELCALDTTSTGVFRSFALSLVYFPGWDVKLHATETVLLVVLAGNPALTAVRKGSFSNFELVISE